MITAAPAAAAASIGQVHRAVWSDGLEVAVIRPVLPWFRYRAVDAAGVVENEVCPVFAATAANSCSLYRLPRP